MLMSHETILAAIFVASACLVGKTGEPEATTQGTILNLKAKQTLPFLFKWPEIRSGRAEMSILGEHGNMKMITNDKNDKID